MFDTIGVVDDPDGQTRKALSALLSGLLLGAGIAGSLAWGSFRVVSQLGPTLVTPEVSLVLLDMVDEAPPPVPTRPPLEAPTAPAGQAAPGDTPAPVEQVADTPAAPRDDLVEEPQGTDAVESPALVLLENVPTRFGGGLPASPPKRREADAGKGLSTVPSVDNSVLQLRRRVKPDYPPSESGRTTCTAVVRIAPDGKPALVQVQGCPKIFAVETRLAIRKWRWSHPVVDGVNQAVQTTYEILYVPDEN